MTELLIIAICLTVIGLWAGAIIGVVLAGG